MCRICDLLLPQICFPIVPETLIRTSQMSGLHICNSKLTRSMINVITLFVIPRFEFHNEYVEKKREGEKTGKMSDFSQNQCLSTALRSSLTRKGIHMHLAAIVGCKMTNHNIIDVLKKRLQTTVPLTTFAPIQKERVNLIVMTPVSFQAPFQASSSSWGWKSKRWDESSAK